MAATRTSASQSTLKKNPQQIPSIPDRTALESHINSITNNGNNDKDIFYQLCLVPSDEQINYLSKLTLTNFDPSLQDKELNQNYFTKEQQINPLIICIFSYKRIPMNLIPKKLKKIANLLTCQSIFLALLSLIPLLLELIIVNTFVAFLIVLSQLLLNCSMQSPKPTKKLSLLKAKLLILPCVLFTFCSIIAQIVFIRQEQMKQTNPDASSDSYALMRLIMIFPFQVLFFLSLTYWTKFFLVYISHVTSLGWNEMKELAKKKEQLDLMLLLQYHQITLSPEQSFYLEKHSKHGIILKKTLFFTRDHYDQCKQFYDSRNKSNKQTDQNIKKLSQSYQAANKDEINNIEPKRVQTVECKLEEIAGSLASSQKLDDIQMAGFLSQLKTKRDTSKTEYPTNTNSYNLSLPNSPTTATTCNTTSTTLFGQHRFENNLKTNIILSPMSKDLHQIEPMTSDRVELIFSQNNNEQPLQQDSHYQLPS